jgi:hypothetical protein
MMHMSKLGHRVFRNNVGLYYTKNGFPVKCGLCAGSGDLIGWKVTKITPDMVGKMVAVFTSIEVKTESGRLETDQILWADNITKMGGIAICARSEKEAEEKISQSL